MSNQTETMRAAASGKLSPNFGSLPDRLNRAGYRPSFATRSGSRISGLRGGLGDGNTLGFSPWLYYGVSYASSFAGGAGVGYVVARTWKGAGTGGLTSSGVWCLAEGFRGAREAPVAVTAGLFGLSAVSLWLAWRRK